MALGASYPVGGFLNSCAVAWGGRCVIDVALDTITNCARAIAMNNPMNRPLVGLTMGDVAGIGPEVIARRWREPRLHDLARPLVIGDPACSSAPWPLSAAPEGGRSGSSAQPEEADPSPRVIPCLAVAADLGDLPRSFRAASTPRRAAPPIEFSHDGRQAGAGRPDRRHHDPAPQ